MSKEQQQEIRDLLRDCDQLLLEVKRNLAHKVGLMHCERYYIDEELIPDYDILEEFATC